MARRRPVSALFYAINGRGLGHLTRLLAVARAARELLEALDVPSEFELVTTSEASFIADDFPVYKLPSKTAVARSQAVRERYMQRAKLLVSNLVAAKSPDLLVLDTVPYGAFQEFAFLRGYARASAYLYRHQDQRSAESDLVQRHLDLFDRIVVPDDDSRADEYPVSRAARSKLAFVGTIHSFDHANAWSPPRVRAHFGVPEGKRLIFVAAGGGGDGRGFLDALVGHVADDPRNFVLAGYGPLHRGELRYAPNIVPLTESAVSKYFPGVDAAISAAGYNSYEELLAARVPTLFFAQPKGLDRQDLRVARGSAAGWHGEVAEHASAELVLGRLEDILTGSAGSAMRAELERRPASQGALRAAVELLAVCSSLDGSSIDRAALFEAAAERRDADRASAQTFVPAWHGYRAWRALAMSAPAVAAEQDAASARWWSNAPASSDGGPSLLATGCALLEIREALGADEEAWRMILRALAARPASRSRAGDASGWIDTLRALVPHKEQVLAHTRQKRPANELLHVLLELSAENDAGMIADA